MSTREERAEEARQERRENPDCIGCALGIGHEHPEEPTDD